MENFINWVINSSKVTDWLNLLLTFIIAIPVLITLNDKYKWYSKIKNKYKNIKKYYINTRKKIKLFFLKRRVYKYFKQLTDTKNTTTQLSKSTTIKNEKGGIRLTAYNGDTFLFPNYFLNKTFRKFNLKECYNRIPIEIMIELINFIKYNELSTETFFIGGSLVPYENLIIDNKRTIKRRCPDVNCGEVIEVDIKPSDVRIN